MKNLFNCTFEFEITPKKTKGTDSRPYNVGDSIQMENFGEPSKAEIKATIHEQWKRKGIRNHRIVDIYTPEKID
jgi:hypothetical protein